VLGCHDVNDRHPIDLSCFSWTKYSARPDVCDSSIAKEMQSWLQGTVFGEDARDDIAL